jgi:hypothetical protein
MSLGQVIGRGANVLFILCLYSLPLLRPATTAVFGSYPWKKLVTHVKSENPFCPLCVINFIPIDDYVYVFLLYLLL